MKVLTIKELSPNTLQAEISNTLIEEVLMMIIVEINEELME